MIPSNYVAASIGEASNNEVQFPLHEAAKRGQLDFLRECVQQRIPLNGLDKSGSTPLYWAAYGGHDDCVKEILKYGRKVQVDVQVRQSVPVVARGERGGRLTLIYMLGLPAKSSSSY